MFRLLALTLWMGCSSAFAFQATRISCTSQNASFVPIPMTVKFHTNSGRIVTAETPFNYWIVPDEDTAKALEFHRHQDDASPVLIMPHARLLWNVVDTNVELDLERTFRGEVYAETTKQNVMIVGTADKGILAGLNGWMFSCSEIGY